MSLFRSIITQNPAGVTALLEQGGPYMHLFKSTALSMIIHRYPGKKLLLHRHERPEVARTIRFLRKNYLSLQF
jgi:hypothetical protein